jgi:hypothetical protein
VPAAASTASSKSRMREANADSMTLRLTGAMSSNARGERYLTLGFGITSRLGAQVIQGRDRRGRRIACNITPLSARQQRRGIFREGLAVEQYVKNNIGIEQDSQRYLSSRYRR